MDLSIIIVNYNAKAFLDLCLQSVKGAIKGMDAEVLVVDNASTDGAPAMVRSKHSWVKLIANSENTGFSKANNQGIKEAAGSYIVIQNPDTIVAEDSYVKCLSYFKEKISAGALGVKMLDGSGAFLPESKRGIPSPKTAFFKAFGFAKLFPKSKFFSSYYLGHLNPDENNPVEILAGAFICVKKEVLEKAGLFDEDFFMFGEDIDLSYRFIQAGYENWYLADVPIIHFKGESSKKTDETYLNSFFGAMDIFYDKHFSSGGGRWLKWAVSLGIKLKRIHFKRKAKTNIDADDMAALPEHIYIIGDAGTSGDIVKRLLNGKSKVLSIESLSALNKDHYGAALVFTSLQTFSETIDFMNVHSDKFTYYFLSEDGTFLLGSPKKDSSGMVWE